VSFLRKYLIEAAIGLVLALVLFLALAATVGTVPFIYQGY
jgi:hypothetical protein